MLSDVAKELEVTKGSASVQIKSLKEKHLVEEVDNRLLALTEAGEMVATEVEYTRQVLLAFVNRILCVDSKQAEVDACKIEHLLSRESRHQIFALVQLLQSDDPLVREFKERFDNFKVKCPSPENCSLCQDECMFENDPSLCCSVEESSGTDGSK